MVRASRRLEGLTNSGYRADDSDDVLGDHRFASLSNLGIGITQKILQYT
jgi:hypothetical protein